MKNEDLHKDPLTNNKLLYFISKILTICSFMFLL